MAYKDILVHVDTAKSAAARLDFAAALAQRHDAHLTALHVVPPPYIPADIMGTGVGAEVVTWHREQRDRRLADFRDLIAQVQQRHGISIEQRVADGGIEPTILDHSRYTDLIVVSQPADLLDLEQPIQPSPGNLVIGAGCPVLVLPAAGKEYIAAGHVLIAWKPCAEAARAVRGALPLLKQAKAVTVLAANVDTSDQPRVAGADIATHLARHGVKVTVTPFTAPDMDVGSLLLARAADLGADMIVMGGYGHSRLREMVLGGVTYHILKNQFIPVFLAS